MPPPSSHFDWPSVGRVLSAGGTALVITLAVGSLSPAGFINMATAYVMLLLSWILGVIVIVLSEVVWKFPVRHRILSGIAAALLLGTIIFGIAYLEYWHNLTMTTIVPGDEPTPSNTCDVGKDMMTIILGSNVAAENGSIVVFAMGRDEDGNPFPLLTLKKDDETGSWAIERLRLFSNSGVQITNIDMNKLWFNSNFRNERPNYHTIIAFDDNGNETLKTTLLPKMRFLYPAH
jgi:hypothetical protein